MTSFALNLSIFFVVVASICYSAPIVQETTSSSLLLTTARLGEEKNESVSNFLDTTEKSTEEKTTNLTSTSTDSSAEAAESRESREISDLEQSESPVLVSKTSSSYPKTGLRNNLMDNKFQSIVEVTTDRIVVVPLKANIQEAERRFPTKSSTPIGIISPASSSSMSSDSSLPVFPTKSRGNSYEQAEPVAEKFAEYQQEKPLKFETTSKIMPKVVKKVTEYREETPVETEKVAPVSNETETKGDFKVAEYDPQALDLLSTLETVKMQYDENHQIITISPIELTTASLNGENLSGKSRILSRTKSLDQVTKSPVVEEEKSNY